MASPQLESGYIRIANEIWDEVIRRDFTKRQKDILFFIWRLSYGCQKRAAYIPQMKQFELCGVSRTKVKDELMYLEKCRVLIWDQQNKLFEINKDYENWYISLVKTWDEQEFEELISMNLSQRKFPKRELEIPETGTLEDEEDEEEFPKRESKVPEKAIDGSQKGNSEFPKRELKVPEKGIVTPDEPNGGAASEASKDSKDSKDIIKDSKDNNNSGCFWGEEPDINFARAYQIIERNFGLVLNPIQRDELEKYLDKGMESEVVERASHITRKGGKDISYMWGILSNCFQRGIVTAAAFDEEQARRKEAQDAKYQAIHEGDRFGGNSTSSGSNANEFAFLDKPGRS
ncbi:replication protein [Paenibacillus apiarius]|uniref:replication protein n=1 Tax=Paenibacillus apiarius TaxID=46240 RepID=UPI003B3A9B42